MFTFFIPCRLPECSILSKSFALCERRPKIPLPECSTPMRERIYIYIYNPWKIVCDPGFHVVLQKTTIIRQLRWNESKIRKNTDKKTLGFRLCVVVSVCGCVRMGYSYVWMCVFMRCIGFSRNEFKCILIICYIIYLGDYSYGTKHHHCMSGRMKKNLICKRI